MDLKYTKKEKSGPNKAEKALVAAKTLRKQEVKKISCQDPPFLLFYGSVFFSLPQGKKKNASPVGKRSASLTVRPLRRTFLLRGRLFYGLYSNAILCCLFSILRLAGQKCFLVSTMFPGCESGPCPYQHAWSVDCGQYCHEQRFIPGHRSLCA